MYLIRKNVLEMHRELKQVNNNGDKSEKEGSCQLRKYV